MKIPHSVLSSLCDFASKDETRLHLCAVAILPGRKLVATNGHVLIRFHNTADFAAIDEDVEKPLLLKADAMRSLLRRSRTGNFHEPVTITVKDRKRARVVITEDGSGLEMDWTAPLIEETPVDFEAAMPTEKTIAPGGFALNADYLALLAKVQKTCSGARPSKDASKRMTVTGSWHAFIRLVSAAGELEPVWWQVGVKNDVRADVVIMPVRW